MIILIQCKDKIGLVAAISGALADEQINIISLREHVDKTEGMFFIRVETENETDLQAIEKKLVALLPGDAIIRVNPIPEKKIVIMVTKEYHCVADLLIRNHFKTLGASIICMISNHGTLRDISSRFNIPFHTLSKDAEKQKEFEQEIIDILDRCQPDYIVLAKFMRILSPGFVAKYPMRIINIHHSFLPAFSGAKPYRRAFERGVKLIGATAHFVTNELDEGPIIAQEIISVDHSYTVEDMVKAGKEIETAVLTKALQLIFSDSVFVYRNKTIVFE